MMAPARSAAMPWPPLLLLLATAASLLSPVFWPSATFAGPRGACIARAAAPWDGIFGASDKQPAVRVPETVEELAEALQDSMALALAGMKRGQRSRLDVELPPGLPLGLESALGPLEPPKAEPTAEEVDRGDRELASAFLLLFEALKKERALCIAFRTERLAASARRLWKEWGQTRIIALQGFGGDDALRRVRRPFLVAVAPGTEELNRLSKFADERGEKLCLILLNARIRGTTGGDEVRDLLALESEAVFHFRFAGADSDGVLYRAISTAEEGKKASWVLVRRLAGGSPEQLLSSERQPSAAAISDALSSFWR